MIQFQMFDHQPERCEKYHQMLKDNLPVLEGIGSEADFEKYGDSLGWFDIDTWANEAELSAIEELAARVRRDADVFVDWGAAILNQLDDTYCITAIGLRAFGIKRL